MLPGGALYTRQSMIISAAPVVTPASRSELEADIAAVGKANATDDKALQALVAKVDRSKTVWFVGTGANTPIADKLGEVYGSFDIASGLAADVTIQLKDSELAGPLEDGVKEMQRRAVRPVASGDFQGTLVEGLVHARRRSTSLFAIKISETQLAGIIKRRHVWRDALQLPRM